jgi:hypothetical protein
MAIFGLAALAPIATTLMRLGPAAMRGYRTLKGIRQARAVAGQPMGYQRALGTPGQGLGTGTSGTGLQGLMARGAKKFPGTTGSLEAGTGVLLGGEGVGDIMEGVSEGDIGQTAMGIGSLALGTPLLARGSRLLGAQKTLKKKFPETAAALQATGKGVQQRIPKGTGAVGIGGIGTGIVLGDKPSAEEQVLGEPVQFTVNDVLSAVKADKANIGQVTVIDGKEVIIGSEDYKTIAKQKLDEAYKSEQTAGTTPVATIDQIADVFKFPDAVTGGANITNEGSLPKVNKETDLSEGEINFLANKQDKEAESGAGIKDKMLKSKEADEFNAFYKRITNLTGGNDQTSNLLLFKFATGLMSGKTAQDGVRGFLDVAGQAGSGVADTALALFAKEQDRRKDLAVAFLKAKEKQSPNGIQADKERRTVVVRDSSLPFGARTVQIGTDKKTGLDVMFVPTPDGSGTMAVPMKYTEYTPVKVSPARLDKMRKQLSSIEQGYKFTQIVNQLPSSAFGLTAKGKLGFEKLTGLVGDVGELIGIGDIGSASSNADAEIIDLITADKIDDAGNIVASTEAERKESAKLVEDYKKEIRSITDGIDVTAGELDNITRARLIEVRMKYILANANKSEDRLTRADVQDAEQATRILGFTTGEREVKSSYKNLASDLEAQFLRLSKNYIEAGGNEDFLLSFTQMPYIRSIYASRANKNLQAGIAQNQEQILGTIE